MSLQQQQRDSLLRTSILFVCVLLVGCNGSPPEGRRTPGGPAESRVGTDDGMQPLPLPPSEGDSVGTGDEPGRAGPAIGPPRGSDGGTRTTASTGPAPTTTTAKPGGGSCPDPRYCDHYSTSGYTPWQPDAAGRVTIRYRINPQGAAASRLTHEQIVAVIRASAEVWTSANPQVHFVYEGITSEAPANFNNVVGFSPNCGHGYACAWNGRGPNFYFGTHTDRFHMAFHNGTPWTWDPCDPARGEPCSPDPEGDEDIADVAVHEWGHVLGLGHVDAPEDFEMTMREAGTRSTVQRGAPRNRATLGLGEVLGVRRLYPTSAPMPVLYRP